MRYLVTGGAGFIGSYLVERLLATGAEVDVLDDLSTGRRANLAAVAGRPGLALHVGSACDRGLVRELAGACDVVVHLAAAVGVRLAVERTLASMKTNLEAAQTVLDAADRSARPVVLASSSEVYGKGRSLPFAEDDDLVLGATATARWSYAGTKAVAEWLARAYHEERGLPVAILRLFNTVGPRQRARYGMVLPRFVRQALDGEPITVHGTGTQTRCFADVRDVAAAVARLASARAARGRVVNVGSDREISIRALAEKVRAAARSASPIVHVPHRAVYGRRFEDPARRVPDLRRLRSLIGEVTRTPLERTIADVVAEQRRRRAPVALPDPA